MKNTCNRLTTNVTLFQGKVFELTRTKRFHLKTASKLLHLIERCDWFLRQNCKIKPPLFFDREFKKIAHTNFWSFFVTQNCNFSFNTFSSLSVKEKDVTSPKKYAGMWSKKEWDPYCSSALKKWFWDKSSNETTYNLRWRFRKLFWVQIFDLFL